VIEGGAARFTSPMQRARLVANHPSFLRFPGDLVDRIIALPAFLGDVSASPAEVGLLPPSPANVQDGDGRGASAVLLVEFLR